MTPISASSPSRRAGYSLLEVIAVVAIIAIAITLSAPSISRMLEGQAAQGVVRSLDITLVELRRDAIIAARPIPHATAAARLRAALERGWALELSPAVAFTAGGFCPGGQAELTSPDRRRYTVRLSEGACTIERQ